MCVFPVLHREVLIVILSGDHLRLPTTEIRKYFGDPIKKESTESAQVYLTWGGERV